MSKRAAKVVEAVYEHGVFRPVRKVALPDRSRVRLTLVPLGAANSKTRSRLIERQRKALLDIAGIGASGRTDISENPHQALYGTDRAR